MSPGDWALVLAGGQGKRLAHLTIAEAGLSVPKQFCSLGRGSSLLHEALRRARAVAPPERILVTVSECHETWWRELRHFMPRDNLLVQPEQRGTGIGILHPLLEILRRDPASSLAVLPADHYFRDESVIADGLRAAMNLTRRFPRRILLIGVEPESHDAALGYIIPTMPRSGNLCEVERFIEKPADHEVSDLIGRGALWNSFVIAADAHALLDLFERHYSAVVAQLRNFVDAPPEPARRDESLARLFREIPSIDFSEDLIALDLGRLLVLRLPPCGWSDLGTPARLHRVLHRHGADIDRLPVAPPETRGHLDLAARARRDAASGLLPTTPSCPTSETGS